MSERSVSILRALVGSELSTVAFVRDYLQLGFEESLIGEPEPGLLRAPTAGTSGGLSAFTLPQLQVEVDTFGPASQGIATRSWSKSDAG